MKHSRLKILIQEAAKLPPAKARALVAAVCERRALKAKEDAAPAPAPATIDDLLETAAEAMQNAMEIAILAEIESAKP